MAGRGKKGAGTSAAPTPLQGALTEGQSVEGLALQRLIMQMDEIQKQQVGLLNLIQQSTTATSDRLGQLELALAQEKIQSLKAQEFVNEQIQKILDARRPDPETVERMTQASLEEAKRQMESDKAKFLQALKDMPKGELFSEEQATVNFIINGVSFLIKPGLNNNVPASYIQAWERRKQEKQWYQRLDMAFQSTRDANSVNALRGFGPIYHEDHGML